MIDQLSQLEVWKEETHIMNQSDLSCCAEARMQAGFFTTSCYRKIQPPLQEGLLSKHDSGDLRCCTQLRLPAGNCLLFSGERFGPRELVFTHMSLYSPGPGIPPAASLWS